MKNKNILLIFTDQQRWDTIEALGNPIIRTPALNALVEKGTAFTRAYTPCPVCVPARYSMKAGQMPHRTGCTDEEYDVVNNKHDKGFKYLLSVKKVFVQLLRCFVDQGWVEKIDEDNLILVDKSFVLQDFKDKEADLVYRVKLDGKEVIFYILLELQSTVDFQMPYRLLLYMVEIWRTICKDAGDAVRRKEFKLPAVVPCVLYNGYDNWTVCRSFKDTLGSDRIFDENIVDFKYILFDVKRYDENMLLELANVIGTVFFIDQKPEFAEVIKRLDKAMAQLSKLDQSEQELFIAWLKNVIMKKMSKEQAEKIEKVIEESKEGNDMVYAIELAIEKEFEKREQRGIEKGIEEGIEKGIERGIERTARNLLAMGITIEQVVQGTGLTYERVQELKKEANWKIDDAVR